MADVENIMGILAEALKRKPCVFCGGRATSFGYFLPDPELSRRLLVEPGVKLAYNYAVCGPCGMRPDATELIRDHLVGEAEALSGRTDLN
jgi:hypothetical protein